MINIDNLNVEQPRELNIDIGHNSYLTNSNSSAVTSSSNSNITHDINYNETRLNETFVETFYDNAHLVDDIKQAMKESNISYFVHKVLSKRNAKAELTAEDLEINRPDYRVTSSNDSDVFYDDSDDQTSPLVASLKKEDIVIERLDSDESGSGSGADSNIETMMTSPLTQDYSTSNQTNDKACHQFLNSTSPCSEAQKYLSSHCSSQENSKPSSEFFQHHQETNSQNNKNKGGNLRVTSTTENSREVECCKVADAIELMKMLNRIMRIKEENIDLLAISRLKKEKKWKFKVGRKELIFGNKEIANLKKNGFKAYKSNIKVDTYFEK